MIKHSLKKKIFPLSHSPPSSYYPFLSFLQPNFLTCLNSCLFSQPLNCSSLAFPPPPALFLLNSLVPCHQSNGHFQSFKSWLYSIYFVLYYTPQVYQFFSTFCCQAAAIAWLLDYNSGQIASSLPPSPFSTAVRWHNITNNAFSSFPFFKTLQLFPICCFKHDLSGSI